ncbi:ExeA family protein [Thiorhodovibrio frisius]|uniref:Type II secretory pathway, component ExeA (Predicted ATPase) n=1 Tax=Thiorhodovibrio frisius TaxID=631362 RepID=H8YYC0_9GAMM|nr:AAA family ATPase [Thiorhodovibrio frisius]EIC23446.1 type II secretory pathway, component ExeA (predicted ATPase) [Thiorhodovibrio frisius]WPL23471.1 putative secretion ATPase, PEP-CTERM locus subfamily [Thiorhodovibrio frisius]
MYENFYGFKEKPFSLLPDPSFLFPGRQYSRAFALLGYAVVSNAGLAVITGEVGCGKTTLIRQMLNQLTQRATVGLITNTANMREHLLKRVMLAFRQEYRDMGPVELHEALEDFLIGEYARGQHTILIVDEAQNLSIETLEELRLFSNINADKDQVLQLLLVGQPGLKQKLEHPDLQQLAQRVVVSFHLSPLRDRETPIYIRYRVRHAGGNPDLFTDAAAAMVHAHSGGVPRLINVLCDMALVYGYRDSAKRIDTPHVEAVINDRTGREPPG